MSVTVDPRFTARRRTVREQSARRRLRWVVLTLGLLLGAGGGVWLLQSPMLDVDRVVVNGSRHADVAGILDRAGVRLSQPMVSVRTGKAEELLMADPWIRSADVDTDWPATIRVEVVEHRPVAWVEGSEGWLLTAADGAVVATAPEATPGEAVISVPASAAPGDILADPLTLAALQFVASLPPALSRGVGLSVGDRGLVAVVSGFAVRLGGVDRPADKAAITAALISSGVAPGSALDVSAPNRPAVLEPGPAVASDDDSAASQPQVEGETSSG